MTCHDCRAHLPGYIHRELSPLVRRRVGAHLDKCEACYAVYTSQREVARELTQQVPLIGQADAPRLGKIWSSIQVEMARPRRSTLSRIPRRRGFAIVILVLVLLLPSLGFHALQQRQVAMALPVPPTPTETSERTSQAVAMATATCNCAIQAAATAAPEVTLPAQPNYPPNTSGTEVP
jgi:predicted anti-sigma-YlaC factor YlaD